MKVAVVLFLTMMMVFVPSCALLDSLDQSLEGMNDVDFSNLYTKVMSYGELGGVKKVREKIGDDSSKKLAFALSLIVSSNNEDRAKSISQLLNDPETSPYLELAVSAALDFIESQTETVLDIKAILKGRKGQLLEAIVKWRNQGAGPNYLRCRTEITAVSPTATKRCPPESRLLRGARHGRKNDEVIYIF